MPQPRDESAFELLVWRHAALVQRVCRAVLRDHHAAEDAAQAVRRLEQVVEVQPERVAQHGRVREREIPSGRLRPSGQRDGGQPGRKGEAHEGQTAE